MDSLPPTIIDIEASGFGPASYPIEVGCVLPDGESYCTLIQPEPGWQYWDDRAEALHGIQRDLLLRCGRSPQTVAQALNDKLLGRTVYTDSWYHDYTWLSRLFDAADTSPHFNLQDLRLLLARTDTSHWDAARQAVTEELQLSRHRASNDARILQYTVMRVVQQD
ncbi:hypothetical protein [Chitinimonas sp.]|uniref:3'-5' exonuclease n=1 Tax=Chitinimonas sp. TaxID=1934313 RepID=UPI002F95CFF2